MIKKWTQEEIATGYEVMAEINLSIAREFAPLEEEAALLSDETIHD